MDDNRRKHERVRAPKIQVRVATLDRLRALYLEDLSQGGIFIRTEKTLPIGSPVDVELFPPDSPPLALSGKVVRTVTDEEAKREKRAGMGVKFEDLALESASALAALVARLKEAPAARTDTRTADLEMELADLKGKLEAYEVLHRQLELDEETSRRLAERLAHDKTEALAKAEKLASEKAEALAKLDKLARDRGETQSRADKEAEKFAEELARLRQQISAVERRSVELEDELEETRQAQATTEAALDAERREHENTLAELKAVQQKKGGDADVVARLQQALEDERAKVEVAKAREREVRNLLSLVSGDGAAAPTKAPTPAPAPKTATPEPAAQAAPQPPPPAPKTAPEALEDFDIAFQDPVLVPENLPSPKEAPNPDLVTFGERLRKAQRIHRTDRYHSHNPTDPAEMFIFDLLSRVQTLEELAKWTEGRVSRERLVQIVFEFQSRSLINLE